MRFLLKSFSELTALQLHKIYQLRAEVFVVEQNCPYQDVDDYDLASLHALILNEEDLLAYARIIPPTNERDEAKIGRVVVRKKERGKNLGRELMKYCIKQAREKFDCQMIVISAQTYLLDFYSSLGFKAEGEGYLEDGIPHQQMRYTFS
jgi:ElaA protein